MQHRFSITLAGLLTAVVLIVSSPIGQTLAEPQTQQPEPAQTKEANPPSVQIIETGVFHGNEVSASDGETWFGLFETPSKSGKFKIQPVTIRVDIVEDPIVDGPGEKTGKKISLKDGRQPLVLLKGVEGLAEGPAPTLHSRFKNFLTPKMTIANRVLKLDKSNSLIVDSLPMRRSKEGKLIEKLMLTYVEGDVAQMLDIPDIYLQGDTHPGLLWVGDLDGDGYMDLIMRLSHHYNVMNLTLFLSSEAEPGDLVKKVAEWITTGC